MMRRAVDGEERTLNGLRAIAAIAGDMRAALVKGDLEAAARLLDREWSERRTLSPRVSTELTEKTMDAARRAGAAAGKVCGAGGGGCIVFLCPEEKRAAVVAALESLSGDGVKVLPARPTSLGLQVAWK
jgi:D-glycero-alpha-D-manno-heptose-7-phosphate kinase